MKLYEKIIKLRKEKGLSQEELGNAINVSRQAISKWESGQTKPDIDKINIIANFFDVSYEYLLNDDVDNIEDKKYDNKRKSNMKKIVIKIILILVIIYLLISCYKFIGLLRIYKVADSFSEENYQMMQTYESNGEGILDYYIKKVGNKIIKETRNPYDKENLAVNENGEIIPCSIEFIDIGKKQWYTLNYDDNCDGTKIYLYEENGIQNVDTKEDLDKILDGKRNYLKELTLSHIPSNLKEIILASLSPTYQISLARNEIYINNFNRFKKRIILTKDGLVENYIMKTEFDGDIEFYVSYDYVQDHFEKEIQSPLEIYKDKIINLEDVKYEF